MSVPKPPSGTLRDVDTEALLQDLRRVRGSAGRVEVQLRRRSAHRAVLEAFRQEIDELAGLITGDRTYFHQGAHSAAMSSPPEGDP